MPRSSKPKRPSGAGQRPLRVGEAVRHALAEVLARGEVRDPDLRGRSITVSEVRVSPDLRHATAFVVPLGGTDVERVVAALKRAAPYLRGQVARLVDLRMAIDLHFAADQSFDYASRIDAALRRPEVRRDVADSDDSGSDPKTG